MGDWLQMIDDETARQLHALFAATVALMLIIERRMMIGMLRQWVARTKIRHIMWIAEELDVDPCELLRLHPTMHRLREDLGRV